MKKVFSLILTALLLTSIAACGSTTPAQSSSAASVADSSVADSSAADVSAQSEVDGLANATVPVDGVTSASVVPEDLVRTYEPKGFTESTDKKKALFVVGDPRKYSVNYELANTAMEYFEAQGVEVELRDLYDIGFNPVISADDFYNAKDGHGETPADVLAEQAFVTQADYIIFVYPNWHDAPNAMVKGYMERVFAKKFAYKDAEKGLEGLLTGKSIYTIMNCGFLGGGRGFIGDGVGLNDETWDKYMNAFKVMDDDTAGFWGVTNLGRFVNDRTPKNDSETYADDLAALTTALKEKLEKDFFPVA